MRPDELQKELAFSSLGKDRLRVSVGTCFEKFLGPLAGRVTARLHPGGPADCSGGGLKLFLNAVATKEGGGITYIGSFLKHAGRLRPDWQFVVFLPPKTITEIQPLPGNVRAVATEIAYAPWWKRLGWDQVTLRRILGREKPDALFSTANFGMLACPIPQVLLIQNAVYFSPLFEEQFLHLSSFSDRASFRLRRWLSCQSVRSADVVLTPTATTLDDLRRHVEVPGEKALVSNYGVEAAEGPPHAAPASPANRDEPFRLLYVSHYRQYKNLTTVLKALRELRRKGEQAYRLTTTLNPEAGEAFWATTSPEDRALLADPLIQPAVEMAGPCAPSEALQLYERCDLFVFPSLVESFGFPMVEAMLHGLPIVASDTPVNREICGEALYFPPFDFKKLAAQIERLARDSGMRDSLSKAGLARAREVFRSEAHVSRVLDTVENLANRGRSSRRETSGGFRGRST